jgi:DNA-binding CsgD family transcriptional regulator
MPRLAIAEAFVARARASTTRAQLYQSLEECCDRMHLRFFALLHHVDFAHGESEAIRLHNYPEEWQHWFDDNRLGRTDPVHRASQSANVGFAWSAVPAMIKLTPRDESILALARLAGIGDGFTVPAHVPGEIQGSCSFAVQADEEFPRELYPVVQLIGGFAFEAARRLTNARDVWAEGRTILTDRQRDCVLWAARGKTDWEISRILDIRHETVIQHLKHARERYGVQKRAMLAVRALFDGLICFADILQP